LTINSSSLGLDTTTSRLSKPLRVAYVANAGACRLKESVDSKKSAMLRSAERTTGAEQVLRGVALRVEIDDERAQTTAGGDRRKVAGRWWSCRHRPSG
jgi:hypothetical protein